MLQWLLMVLLVVVSLFMILLIMIQRGKGGGLAGAFGGAGGQSAFGTKAGDTFTKITVYTALFWISLCVTTLMILNGKGCSRSGFNFDAGGRNTAPASGTLPDSPTESSSATTTPIPPPVE